MSEAKLGVKRTLASKRNQIQEIKSDNMPLGVESVPISPEDLRAMYAGEMAMKFLRLSVAMQNAAGGYERSWGEIPKEIKLEMGQFAKEAAQTFEAHKRKLSKMVEPNPLWKRLKPIKGFTSYQLGIIMAAIKRPERFPNPGNLMVYAGLAELGGMALTKGNLNKIKVWYIENKGREFKGYNTELQGRLLGVMCDCLLRARGFFYKQYTQIRVRLEAGAKNSGKAEEIDGKWMMVGKKNQSLIAWSNSNAKRRIARILLGFVYEEWMKIKGFEVRAPYQFEYLNHSTRITLDEVIAAGG